VTDATSTTAPGGVGDRVAIAVALAVVTALFYVPVLDAGFLNWDDPAYVSQNPEIQRALSWHTVGWAFRTYQEGIWHPLTWLSLALDHAIYGLDARGFHLTNLLLHVANTVLVFVVWCRLTGAVARAAFVAALFGLHPMHVESVAWVTERKDVLSTFFWLLTMLAYTRHARVGTVGAYVLVAVAYALGLLAKPMLVTLPFVLLLLDWWPLRRLGRHAILEKIPLLAGALCVIWIGIRAVAEVSAGAVPDPIPLGARVANAIVATTKYLWLTIWPLRLSPWYSHPWFEVRRSPSPVSAPLSSCCSRSPRSRSRGLVACPPCWSAGSGSSARSCRCWACSTTAARGWRIAMRTSPTSDSSSRSCGSSPTCRSGAHRSRDARRPSPLRRS
jgi:hypothetical protein